MPHTRLILALLLASFLIPGVARAVIDDIQDIICLVNTVALWFGIIVFIIAAASILYAALLFFTASGNEEKLNRARLVLVWSLVGIAVALLAGSAASIVNATIGGKIFTVGSC